MYEAMDNAPDKAPARTFMNSKLEWVDKWPDNEPGEPRHREMNMTRYLVGNRTQVGKVGSSALYWAEDKGAALGTLIEDLSSDTSKAKSVNIAREFIKGYNDGLDRNYDGWQIGNQDKEKGQDVFGYMNSNLRSHIGGILKEYVSDIVEEKSALPVSKMDLEEVGIFEMVDIILFLILNYLRLCMTKSSPKMVKKK